MNGYKPIPIGIEDFKEIIDKEYYFVDKTMLIKDILDSASNVTLFTRSRIFGKTFNMSMLKRYFEKTEEDNSYLFNNFAILGAMVCMLTKIIRECRSGITKIYCLSAVEVTGQVKKEETGTNCVTLQNSIILMPMRNSTGRHRTA